MRHGGTCKVSQKGGKQMILGLNHYKRMEADRKRRNRNVGIALAAVFLLSCFLSGCGPKADTPLSLESPSQAGLNSNSRVSVTRIGVIDDEIAYANRRGIYVIKDSHTGKEFIGISGVGITETSSHTYPCGKSTCVREDER